MYGKSKMQQKNKGKNQEKSNQIKKNPPQLSKLDQSLGGRKGVYRQLSQT